MKVLGIDPGTRVTGYGLIIKEANRYRAIDYGCIRPPSGLRLSARYHIIYSAVFALLDQHAPDALSVETPYLRTKNGNVQSVLKLAMARAVILLAAEQHSVPIYEYPPRKAKQAVVGTGGASKEQVQAMIQKLLLLSEIPAPEDAADALALAICHAQKPNFNKEPIR